MELFYGVLMICCAVALFGELMLATRKPQQPAWIGGFILTSIYSIIVISLPIPGIFFVVRFAELLASGEFSILELLLSFLFLAATLLRLKQVRRKIFAYTRFATDNEKAGTQEHPVLPADSYHGRNAA
ncbi:MAG: hypothetical protein R6V84_14160 [Desulfobacterales bacterium]